MLGLIVGEQVSQKAGTRSNKSQTNDRTTSNQPGILVSIFIIVSIRTLIGLVLSQNFSLLLHKIVTVSKLVSFDFITILFDHNYER